MRSQTKQSPAPSAATETTAPEQIAAFTATIEQLIEEIQAAREEAREQLREELQMIREHTQEVRVLRDAIEKA
jgi:tRNA C32,U32 (ribose-2'-O)-methylase TrmJ